MIIFSYTMGYLTKTLADFIAPHINYGLEIETQ